MPELPLPDYSNISAPDYRKQIKSPSGSKEYCDAFHLPIIEHAKKLARGEIARLLDLACGYAQEMKHMGEDPETRWTGVDLCREHLEVAKKQYPWMEFVLANLRELQPQPNSYHGAIGVNALVYDQPHALRVAHTGLMPGGRAAMNFSVVKGSEAYFKYAATRKVTMRALGQDDLVLQLTNGTEVRIPMQGVDLSTHENENIRDLGVQTHFVDSDGPARLLELSGLRIVDRKPFTWQNQDCEMHEDVITFEKPSSEEEDSQLHRPKIQSFTRG